MKTKVYIFPYDERGKLYLDTTGTQLIEFLIGQTLTDAFQAEDNPTRGLQHVRIKFNAFEVVAQKRLNDVKILVYEKQ